MIKCPNLCIQVLFAFAILCVSKADDLPPGVVDTQDTNNVSLSPEEWLARITVPEGFNVTLFAGEPDLVMSENSNHPVIMLPPGRSNEAIHLTARQSRTHA